MKTRFSYLAMFALISLGIVLTTSCKDDDEDVAANKVKTEVMTAFQEMYPNVNAMWEVERGMYKAEFYSNGCEVEAWYQMDGTWVMTVTDLHVSMLPAAVADRVKTDYPDRYIDDCDLVEKPTEKYYQLELDKQGAADIYVKISENGDILP